MFVILSVVFVWFVFVSVVSFVYVMLCYVDM